MEGTNKMSEKAFEGRWCIDTGNILEYVRKGTPWVAKNKGIIVVLDRKRYDLWVFSDLVLFGVMRSVTGVKRIRGDFKQIMLLRRGEDIGRVWEVEEIREIW